MKNIKFIILMLLLMAVPLAGCSPKKTSEPANQTERGYKTTELRIGIQVGPHYAPYFVAKEKKWLEDELAQLGVTLKWVNFASGPPMNEALAAGQVDLGLMGDSPAIIAKAAGQDTSIVGICATGPKALAVILPKNSSLTAVNDLKGKKVGVVKGSYAHHLLALVLQKNGLTLNDVQLINLAHTDIPVALAKGDIDAGAIWEPLITQLEEQDAIKILADGTGIKKGELVLVARNEFASQNPKLLEIVFKNVQRGHDFVQKNPQEAASLISEDVKLKPEQLVKVLSKFDYNPIIRDDDIAELKATTQFMLDAGLIKTSVDIDKFVDRTYQKQAGIL